MSNIIIGTAGHIDHGKTTLIKKLTGIETDRWEEEKKRGITIDLGFAFFDLPDGRRAGIVDVPGHERFIKNMLAGISGIDLVLLVIAADEGVMPQTQEHLDILNLLNVKKGIVVLNKADLVDEEWLEIVKEDIGQVLEGTFLENAPMLPVSAITGSGIDQLVEKIQEMTEVLETKNVTSPPRLPVDRVFTMTGFGTVVTGTLIEGSISEGDELEIYPKGKMTKARRIQVHGEEVATAEAGQRVAINLAGIKREELNRGDVLGKPNSMKTTHMLDVKINLLKSGHREIGNWTRLRLYQGTKEILCRLVLLDRDILKPGEECFAQLRLEEQTACKYGDQFVLRFYSPLETIGGGTILDPNAVKHKRFKEDVLDELLAKNEGDQSQIVEKALVKLSETLPDVNTISKTVGMDEHKVEEILDDMIEEGSVRRIGAKAYVHYNFVEDREAKAIEIINEFHKKNPMKLGMNKEEVRSKAFKNIKGKAFDELLNTILGLGNITLQGHFVKLSNFEIKYSKKDLEKRNKMIKIYKEAAFKPPNLKEVVENVGISKKEYDIVDNLVSEEILVKLNENVYLYAEDFKTAKERLINHLNEKGEITLSEFRDLLGTSRKIAVALLDYFDEQGITKRIEDKRVLK